MLVIGNNLGVDRIAMRNTLILFTIQYENYRATKLQRSEKEQLIIRGKSKPDQKRGHR